jgi:hypothetical protein
VTRDEIWAEAQACTCCASFHHNHSACYLPEHDHPRFGLFDPRFDGPR